MSALAYESPQPQNGLLGYLRGLAHNQLWWKSNANSSAQWAIKYLLVVAGVVALGHGLFVNFGIGLAWDVGAFLINFKIWRKGFSDLKRCSTKTAGIWSASQVKNQGWILLLSGIIGLPIPTAKLVLIPEGVLISPLMFWVNDRFIFGEINLKELASARCRMELCQAVAAGHMAFRRTML